MADSQAIRDVANRLSGATSFPALFGALPAGDIPAKKAYLRKQFTYLARIVHPDHATADCKTVAADAFRDLNALRHKAEEAIGRGTYETPIDNTAVDSGDADSFELASAGMVFRFRNTPYREGDLSILYQGTAKGSMTGPVLAKVARDPSMNGLLEQEAVHMRRAADAPVGTPLARVARFLPRLIDTMLITGEKNTRFRANVFRLDSDLVSVADIMRAYPAGLEASQAAWVARRTIAQTLAASMLGVVHGAITPDHVLVNPFTHDPVHIGWAHAIAKGRITQVIDRWKDIYPPEVFAKKDADHRTDIYMAGATIVRLLGGTVERASLPATVPSGVSKLVLRCLEETPARRPQDGAQLLAEFTTIIRREWGRTYRPLTMPMR